ncbi:MAG: AsmA-like C-terminal region-containing protein [Sumerlaeia bacterium]
METKEAEQESLIKRKWRKYYRRSRIYVPLIVLLLASMVVLLPIRGAWLARLVERQVKEKAGVALRVQSAEVHLLEGSVTLSGLSLEPGSGENPITLERIALRGTLADMLAGDGRYPQQVEVDYGTTIQAERTESGLQLDSALRVLIHTIQQNTVQKQTTEETPPTEGRTPQVTLRNIPLRLNDRLTNKTHNGHISTIYLDARSSQNAPVDISVEGIVNDPLPEKFTATIAYLPETGSLNAQIGLDGFEQKFPAKSKTPFLEIITEQLQLEVSVLGLNQENPQLRADLEIGKLQARHLVSGGRRWNQRGVSLGIYSTLSKSGNPVEEWSAVLSSPVLEVSADGTFNPQEDWQGRANMQIRKTPPVLWSILNEQLSPRGLALDETTSPTLTLYVNAAGDFKTPKNLEVNSEVNLRQMRFYSQTEPYDLTVDSLQMKGDQNIISISRFSGNISNRMDYFIRASIKDYLQEQPTAQIDQLLINGDPGDSLIELRKYIPNFREVLSLSVPLLITSTGNFPLIKRDEQWTVDWFRPETSVEGSIKWDASEVRISQVAQPIKLQPGLFQFTETSASLSSVQASLGEVNLAGDVEINSPSGRWITDASYNTNFNVSGTLRSIFELVQEQTELPFPVTDYSGELKTNLQVTGSIATLFYPDYTLKAVLRKFTGRIPLQYSEVNITEGELDLTATRDQITIPQMRGIINGKGELNSVSFDLTREAATLAFNLNTPLEVLENILAEETMDIYMAGVIQTSTTASFTPTVTLPRADSVIESWIQGIKQAPKPLISLTEQAPFELNIDGKIIPTPTISVFQRDMPHPVQNIRGGITLDQRGFVFDQVVADLGNSKDAQLNGRVNLGHYGGGVQILMDVQANKLDFNDWFTGWGSRDYAKRTFVEPAFNIDQTRPEKMITEVEVNLNVRETALLSVQGTELDAFVRFEAWRKQPNKLFANLRDARVYGGRLGGDAEFTLPRERTKNPAFKANLQPQEVEMQEYLIDLIGGKDYPKGKVTGNVTLAGEIGDYNTWVGEADFRATKSRFIGEQSFVLLTNFLNLGDRERQADTVISGSCSAKDQIITFPSIKVESSEIRMLASGTVGFNGMTDFLLTVDLYRNQLGGIPIINELNTFLNRLRNSLISFRVSGKIGEQKVDPVPLPIQNIDFFAEGRRIVGGRSSSSRSGSD